MEKLGNANCAADLDQFISIFGLTPAEKQALLDIVNGKSVIQIADEAHLSPETIRTQLKSLYSKTGVNGQAGLLRLVYSQ